MSRAKRDEANNEVLSGVEPEAEAADKPSRGAPRRQRLLEGLTSRLKIYGEIPGYYLAWANDSPGRIAELQARGFEFVRAVELEGVSGNVVSYNKDAGGKIRVVVGSADGGEPLYAYLMKQKLEHREEDMADLEARNSMVDRSIKEGKLNEQENERRYVPQSVGITYVPGR